jgi:hypothetical protein
MKTEGWGVMLWSQDEGTFSTGSVVPVVGISQLKETFDIRTDKKSPIETVPQWRLTLFKRKTQAEDYVLEFSDFSELFAIVRLNGLPVREQRDADAKRVYKLKENEVVKIISRDGEKSTAGEYSGYWYQVLTDGGVTGYTFDRYLELYTAQELAGLDFTEEKDEFLEIFLNSVFRPKHYRTMLISRRINLDRFLPEYGIFHDTESTNLSIVNEEHSTVLDYASVQKVNETSYAFEGSSLIMIIKSTHEVNVQYADEGVQYSEDYVRIDADINGLIISEEQRREEIFNDFFLRGDLLSSTAYGTITLIEGGGFIWEDLERIIPDVVTPSAGNAGRADFRLHVGESLEEEYDGVISFIFSNDEIAHFLYSLQDQGVRFKHIRHDKKNDDLRVEDDGSSPITIFFRVKRSETE